MIDHYTFGEMVELWMFGLIANEEALSWSIFGLLLVFVLVSELIRKRRRMSVAAGSRQQG